MPRSCAATLEAAYARLEQAFEAMRGRQYNSQQPDPKKKSTPGTVPGVLYLGRARAHWRRSDWPRRGYIMHVHDANRKRPRNQKRRHEARDDARGSPRRQTKLIIKNQLILSLSSCPQCNLVRFFFSVIVLRFGGREMPVRQVTN